VEGVNKPNVKFFVTLIIKMLLGMQLANPVAPIADDANTSAAFGLQLCIPVSVRTIV
jgi:hypothetical protein